MADDLKSTGDVEFGPSIGENGSRKYPKTTTESISRANIGDQVAKIDGLGFKPYVTAIANFLTDPNTKPPLTLSIEGEWGSGKSSFMAQLENDLLYLFSWDNIPGDDDWKLKEFLTQDFGIDWVKTAEIEKNNRIIKVTNGDRFLSLRLNYRKTKVYLKVGDVKTEEFTAKTEKDGLKVYTKNKFTVSFNPWRHDNEDSLWAAFALNFIDQLSSQQPCLQRWRGRIKLLFSRFKWKNWEVFHPSAIWLFFVGVTLVVFGFLLQVKSAFTDDVFIASGGIIALIGGFVSFGLKLKNTVGSPFDVDFSKYFNAPDYECRVDFIENFHKDFENIVKAYAGEDKVYVFIDDLDRCEIPKAADLMQAINLMISDPHLIFIVGMDREKVAASIAVKHEKLLPHIFPSDSDPRQGLKYGYTFIEKFIQVPFSVPKPTSDDFEKLIKDLSKPAEKIDTKPDKTKTRLDKIKEYLGLGNTDQPKIDVDRGGIGKTGNNTPEGKARIEEEEARVEVESRIEKRRQTIILKLNEDSERIIDIVLMVAPALDNNPRRIKQFINLFRLRTYIAVQTGLFDITDDSPAGKHLTLEKLGKFVAITLKWPLLLNDLYVNRVSLAQLQEVAIGRESQDDCHWCDEEKLMDILRAGFFDDSDAPIDPEKEQKYSLSGLNVDKLLQVSPEVYPSEVNIGTKFTLIEEGNFMMGSNEYDSEKPVHNVEIKPFYLGTYPVTQREWNAVMGKNSSRSKGDNLPVESVSWDDVQEFIKKLNQKEGTHKYRLPSEAEWEYACRAGTNTLYSFGNDESMLGEYAWYADNSDDKTHPVGQKKPNPWGLYDMHGNVWEWVQDKWHDNYDGAPTDESAWESGGGSFRVLRGGGWLSDAQDCRSAYRYNFDPDDRRIILGFRLLREL